MAAASLQWRTSVKDRLYFCLTSFQTKSTAPSGSTSLPRSMFLASCPATHCSNSLIWNVLFTCLLLEEPHPLSQLEALSSFLYFRDLSLLFESHVYIFSPCLSCKFCPVDLLSPFGHPTAETWACLLFTLLSAKPVPLPESPIPVNHSSVFLSAQAGDVLLSHCYHYSQGQRLPPLPLSAHSRNQSDSL